MLTSTDERRNIFQQLSRQETPNSVGCGRIMFDTVDVVDDDDDDIDDDDGNGDGDDDI